MIYIYSPVWTEPRRWTEPYHLTGIGGSGASCGPRFYGPGLLALAAWWVARRAAPQVDPVLRSRLGGDLAAIGPGRPLECPLGRRSHGRPPLLDRAPGNGAAVEIEPQYDPCLRHRRQAAGEPGYASEKIKFMDVRDPLDWSLPLVWHLNASKGQHADGFPPGCRFLRECARNVRFDLESDTHIVTGNRDHPSFAAAAKLADRLGVHPPQPGRPAPGSAGGQADICGQRPVGGCRGHRLGDRPARSSRRRRSGPAPRGQRRGSGKARIVEEIPERVVIETDASMPAYLVLSDTFDPGWSAIGRRSAGADPAGLHRVPGGLPSRGPTRSSSRYRPAGFAAGLVLTGSGLALALFLWFRPQSLFPLANEHAMLSWPSHWRTWWFLSLGAIVVVSAVPIDRSPIFPINSRWINSTHRHTWGAGVAAMKANRM